MMKYLFLFLAVVIAYCWASSKDRIRLESLQTITLYSGRNTNSRRVSPVPQLECVGGSAGCSSFTPKVVQCYNRGSDGYDVQWECKADMPNKYKFGRIDVNCEGYDRPDDPYVLRGSCGLRYTIDRVGKQSDRKRSHHLSSSSKGNGFFGNLLVIAIICVVIFFIYKTCLTSRDPAEYERPPPYAPEPPPYSENDPPYPTGGMPGAPPPPGFRPEYTSPPDCDARYRGSTTYQQTPQQPAPEGGGPGFFSGALGGAVLGYLFGSRGQSNTYERPYYSSGYGSSYTQPRQERLYPDLGDHSSSSSSCSSEAGSRTASGFGGTSRR